MLAGKHILLGVSGGIAAYKSALLVREFVKAGADVQVLMTPAATQFITPLTLGTLSQREVLIEMFPHRPDSPKQQWTAHIDVALWADIMLVAPATADIIAKIAHGFADSFLTATTLALRCPLAVTPSMDVDMYHHPATQQNIETLRSRGVHILEPDTGPLASGLHGAGRLPEPASIALWIDGILSAQDLVNKRVVVTAGPTHEPLDPVRYLGNASSGLMGFSLARAAAQRGAQVTLIAGPVHLATPPAVRRIDVTTAHEMHDAVMKVFPESDILVMSAAVADFSPVQYLDHKIKREDLKNDQLTVVLKKNPDILKAAGEQRRASQILVGFALETDNGIEHARKKLASKHLDLIVLNNPHEEGAGFGTETNVVTILSANGAADRLPKMPKTDVAHRILDAVVSLIS